MLEIKSRHLTWGGPISSLTQKLKQELQTLDSSPAIFCTIIVLSNNSFSTIEKKFLLGPLKILRFFLKSYNIGI